jgi:ABC-type multidrug transport system ATPase subunit
MSRINAVQAVDLTRIYGRGYALRKANFELAQGTLTAIVGANGAGKSTAFNILSGRIKASSGEVRFNGQTAAFDASQRAQCGFLSHASYLYGGLTAAENLQLVARLFRRDDANVAGVLDQVGLARHSRRQASCFSRGMIQRLALGRLLLQDPQVWLLDEPASGLDEAGRQWLAETIRGLAQEGRVIAFSTHHRQFAAELATHAVVLSRGRVVHAGASTGPDDLHALFEEHVA